MTSLPNYPSNCNKTVAVELLESTRPSEPITGHPCNKRAR